MTRHSIASFINEKVVSSKRNLFLLPAGKPGKLCIDNTSKLCNAWIDRMSPKRIAMKTIVIMQSLLLKKLSKVSKSKDHLKALERTMELWRSGNLLDLFQEGLTIQRNLKSMYKAKAIDQIFRKFEEDGNVM